jgi:hypothetical protein
MNPNLNVGFADVKQKSPGLVQTLVLKLILCRMENKIKIILPIIFFFFAIRQIMKFNDIYCALFLLIIAISVATTKNNTQ